MDPFDAFVNADRALKRKRQLLPSNPRGHANQLGEHQTLQPADHERGILADPRDLATASPSSSRPRRQAPVESHLTRRIKNQNVALWRQLVFGAAEPDSAGDIRNHTSQVHPAQSYKPLDAGEHFDRPYVRLQ